MNKDKMIKDGRLTPEALIERYDTLKGERGAWESHWQEICDYILPNRNTITAEKTEGEKKFDKLLDNTGVQANELLTGAINSMQVHTGGEFFGLTTGDERLDNEDDVRQWMQRTVRSMHNVLTNSNFFTENHEKDLDQCAIGTACMSMEADDKDVVRFSTKFIGEYLIDEDHMGRVNQIYRAFQWSVEKIIGKFGYDAMPADLKKDWDKGEFGKKYTVMQGIYPASLVQEKPTGTVRKFIDQYIIREAKFEIQHGNFDTFPYLVPRWSKAAGEKYGRGPGSVALPECRVLNKMNETMLIGAQKAVDPPVQVSDDGFILPLITTPGGVNYRRSGDPDDLIRPIFNDTRLDFGYQALEDRRKRIRDAFYVDQLRLQQGGPMMTATEVMQRTEEQLRLLGPILGRQQAEFLKPMVDRLFDLMWKRGMIEQPPAILQGRDLGVRYSSFMAKAQRATEGQSIMRWLEAVSPFINLNNAVSDVIDTDAAPRILAGIFNPPQELIRNKDAVDKMRQERAAQAQQMQQTQQALADAQAGAQITQAMGAMGGTQQTG